MNRDIREICYRKVKNFAELKDKNVRFNLNPHLHLSPVLADWELDIAEHDVKYVESSIILERYDLGEPVRKIDGIREDELWNFVYSSSWDDASSLRVVEGVLLERIKEALFTLKRRGLLTTYTSNYYDTRVIQKPKSIIKAGQNTMRDMKEVKDNIKFTLTYFGVTDKSLKRKNQAEEGQNEDKYTGEKESNEDSIPDDFLVNIVSLDDDNLKTEETKKRNWFKDGLHPKANSMISFYSTQVQPSETKASKSDMDIMCTWSTINREIGDSNASLTDYTKDNADKQNQVDNSSGLHISNWSIAEKGSRVDSNHLLSANGTSMAQAGSLPQYLSDTPDAGSLESGDIKSESTQQIYTQNKSKKLLKVDPNFNKTDIRRESIKRDKKGNIIFKKSIESIHDEEIIFTGEKHRQADAYTIFDEEVYHLYTQTKHHILQVPNSVYEVNDGIDRSKVTKSHDLLQRKQQIKRPMHELKNLKLSTLQKSNKNIIEKLPKATKEKLYSYSLPFLTISNQHPAMKVPQVLEEDEDSPVLIGNYCIRVPKRDRPPLPGALDVKRINHRYSIDRMRSLKAKASHSVYYWTNLLNLDNIYHDTHPEDSTANLPQDRRCSMKRRRTILIPPEAIQAGVKFYPNQEYKAQKSLQTAQIQHISKSTGKLFNFRLPPDFLDKVFHIVDDFVVRLETVTSDLGYTTISSVTINRVIPCRY